MARRSEKDIQSETMIRLQEAYPTALILRQNTGAAKNHAGHFVRFGVPGQADLKTIIHGLAVEIEVKSETGRQRKDQKNYQQAVESAGGIYVLGSSPTKILEEIKCKITERLSGQPL